MRKSLSRAFTLIELMIVVAIIGILASIAVPNFMKFQARAKQSEAKANLAGFFTSMKSYFAEHSTYTCGTCGFAVEKNNHYFYDVGNAVYIQPGDGSTACGANGAPNQAQSQTAFTATASANIDTDATCDGWSINDYNTLSNFANDVDS